MPEMEQETQKKENGNTVAIALIQKDIQYMRESMTKMELTLQLLDKNFARKDELKEFERIVKETKTELEKKATHADFVELKGLMEKKVDYSDFSPIKTILSRINWVLIVSVVGALLALVIKAG